MDKKALQTYATWSKQYLEQQIELSLKSLGIHGDDDIREAKRIGEVTVIDGDSTSYPVELYSKRERIINDIKENGYKNVIEEFAYTWFNRFVALRFMEVHGFISHGFRVLSDPAGGIEPEILKNLGFVKGELKLDMALCEEFKQQGKIEELFRYVLTKQCNALSDQLPMLFSSDMGYLDLLLPQSLLKGDTVITRLVEIPEEVFLDEIEIIGWMYQFYISSKKDAVYASKKTITKDTLPAVTQLFTPDWIVRYMAENSVGRIWLESYPGSSLRSEMKYYVEEAEQAPEVQKKLDEIKYVNVNPEDIKVIEPCCGSGHILVYVFDLLFKMYEERGYQKREIPTLILKNNITGLDVDKRASQLASFSLVMKARSINNRFFDEEYYEKPHVYEIKDSQLLFRLDYSKQIQDLNLLSQEEKELIHYIIETFVNGKTIGSLLIVRPINFDMLDKAIEKLEKQAVSNIFNIDFLERGLKRIKDLSMIAKVLSAKYDVLITNPPYRGISSMEDSVKDYAYSFYPDSKTDMFSMFVERTETIVKCNGFSAFLTPYVWMFIQSYEKVRRNIIDNRFIESLIQFEYSAFEEATVPICTFALRNYRCDAKGSYIRLTEFRGGMEVQRQKTLEAINNHNCGFYYEIEASRFEKIPNIPIAYWWRDFSIFELPQISTYYESAGRNKTHGNDIYVRNWWEISDRNRWQPYANGGDFRRWAGNDYDLVDWSDTAKNFYASHGGLYNQKYAGKQGVCWNLITSYKNGFRIKHYDHHYSSAAPTIISKNSSIDYDYYILAFLNGCVAENILKMYNPTLNTTVNDVLSLPLKLEHYDKVTDIAHMLYSISQHDWDSFETSWGFEKHPFLNTTKTSEEERTVVNTRGDTVVLSPLGHAYANWMFECEDRFNKLKSYEEELNRLFIDIYGLQEELSPDVSDEDVTVYKADFQRDIKSFVSYLVGIVMGRYSLDVPGLAYAGGDWDSSKYKTYQPDDDGIVPIYVGVGMEDGLTARVSELVKIVFGEDSFRENMDTIAEALGKANNESSLETLNRYLNDGFYADHVKTYQKRPIYWMFSSGKQKGFKCLVYMHRYNKDTLARINARYYLPESTRQKIALEELEEQIKTTDGKERIRLEKNRQKLFDKYNETIEYGQVLDHMANMYIDMDLNEGVKVNYAKFQAVELVSDSGVKIKKDLLVPLK